MFVRGRYYWLIALLQPSIYCARKGRSLCSACLSCQLALQEGRHSRWGAPVLIIDVAQENQERGFMPTSVLRNVQEKHDPRVILASNLGVLWQRKERTTGRTCFELSCLYTESTTVGPHLPELLRLEAGRRDRWVALASMFRELCKESAEGRLRLLPRRDILIVEGTTGG